MNKRHYEHTLPNIRGSLSNTYTLNIVSHILGFWKSYYEYSRKKEEGVRKGPDRCKEASMK